MNLSGVDIVTLKAMFHKEEAALKTALLEGKMWDDMVEQRYKVTQLAIAIHNRLHPLTDFNPAEFVKRENYSDLVP